MGPKILRFRVFWRPSRCQQRCDKPSLSGVEALCEELSGVGSGVVAQRLLPHRSRLAAGSAASHRVVARSDSRSVPCCVGVFPRCCRVGFWPIAKRNLNFVAPFPKGGEVVHKGLFEGPRERLRGPQADEPRDVVQHRDLGLLRVHGLMTLNPLSISANP